MLFNYLRGASNPLCWNPLPLENCHHFLASQVITWELSGWVLADDKSGAFSSPKHTSWHEKLKVVSSQIITNES